MPAVRLWLVQDTEAHVTLLLSLLLRRRYTTLNNEESLCIASDPYYDLCREYDWKICTVRTPFVNTAQEMIRRCTLIIQP